MKMPLIIGVVHILNAMDLYIASCIVIDEPCELGQDYLRLLARRLRLPPPLVVVLQNQVDTEAVAA